jgi:sugar phosphate isomerase/epimerase
MNEDTLSRRKFIGIAAGAAAAASAGPWAKRALAGALGNGPGERLVPPGKLSIQQFSLRDAITRRSIANSRANGLTPTMGYLGGPNFPEDPTDLGPLLPLPGGFVEVFDYLGSLGYRGIEFFSFAQNVNELGRQPTFDEIRSYLDAAGIASTGTHTGGLGVMYSAATGGLSATGQAQIDIAHTLGHTMIGTAGDPSGRATLGDNPANPAQIGWQEAARRANVIGQILADVGIRWYWHPEQNAFQFFNDPDHPELALVHRIDWFKDHTQPGLVFFEPDIFHAYSGRARFPAPGWSAADPYDPSKLWDAYGFWTSNAHRLVAWHIKDGTRIVPQPLPPTNPFTQVTTRPPTFAPGGLANNDALYTGEGSIGQGYPVDPDPGVVGFKKLFGDVAVKGDKYYIVESDNAIGPATDPGRSLRHAKLGIAYLLGLRGGTKVHRTSHATEDAPSESEAETTVAG